MYHIQAHIPSEARIAVYRCKSWECPELLARLKADPKIGLITVEWLARA